MTQVADLSHCWRSRAGERRGGFACSSTGAQVVDASEGSLSGSRPGEERPVFGDDGRRPEHHHRQRGQGPHGSRRHARGADRRADVPGVQQGVEGPEAVIAAPRSWATTIGVITAVSFVSGKFQRS